MHATVPRHQLNSQLSIPSLGQSADFQYVTRMYRGIRVINKELKTIQLEALQVYVYERTDVLHTLT